MQRDVDLALAHGADGVAFGILQADGRIDAERCRLLRRQIGDREAVFHRAFDVTPDTKVALEQLVDLGFRRVMTSGQQPTALQGAGIIAALKQRAANRIEVLPAAGINARTAPELLARTGCTQLHASLRCRQTDLSTRSRPVLLLGTGVQDSEAEYEATDSAAVEHLVAVVRRDPQSSER
jgi:copper homeostasis protein